MARHCSVCTHEYRDTIDRCLGSGMLLRELAGEYSLSMSALDRHRSHIVASVKRTVERRRVEREEQAASKWTERLEQAYGLAEGGTRAAAQDEKNWPAGARFLAVMAKLIETGLEVDGVIGPAAINAITTTTEQVLILPTKHSIETTCEQIEPGE